MFKVEKQVKIRSVQNIEFLFESVVSIFIALTLFITCGIDSNRDSNDDGLTWIEGQSNQIDSTTYYVSTTGNDDSSGTSKESAFRTLKKALMSAGLGGTIHLLSGTYFESIGLKNLGKSEASIHIIGFDGVPIFDGEKERTIGIFAENSVNLIFESLVFQNYTDIGIRASFCQKIILRDLIVRNNGHSVQLKDGELEGYGIHVENSEDILITGCDVSLNGPNPKVYPDFLLGTGINTFGNMRVRILNNKSYQNTGGGILVEDSYDVLVDSNIVLNNDCDASEDGWWDGGIWVDGGGDVTVRANRFEGNLGCGIEISDEDLQHPKGYVLEDNISTGNYFGIYIWNFGTADWPDTTILRMSGNQITGNLRQDIWIQAVGKR